MVYSRSAKLSYKSNLWQLLNQYTKSPATVHNMDLAPDILRLADKVGVVPGLSVACKLVMQILKTVQVCEQWGVWIVDQVGLDDSGI